MGLKSISKQVVEEFIEELLKSSSLGVKSLDSLKKLLHSGDFRKEDIVKLLQEEESHENS